MEITEETFNQFVSLAIDNIPDEYKPKISNVVFKVEAEPSKQQREALGLRPCDALFGLYEGVPLPRRGGSNHSIVPDIITVFMRPMIAIFQDDELLKKQIYKTVWHEVAHFYGLGHDRIDKIERNLQK